MAGPLPRDFPPWHTCYRFMARWAADVLAGQIRDRLRKRIRRDMGRPRARPPP
ncbi:transposase [Streptomyces niveus]|uniref:transposase n=1 Tax=Streptomyces niveus TaxID=193462 RepID=UPI0036D21A4B